MQEVISVKNEDGYTNHILQLFYLNSITKIVLKREYLISLDE